MRPLLAGQVGDLPEPTRLSFVLQIGSSTLPGRPRWQPMKTVAFLDNVSNSREWTGIDHNQQASVYSGRLFLKKRTVRFRPIPVSYRPPLDPAVSGGLGPALKLMQSASTRPSQDAQHSRR